MTTIESVSGRYTCGNSLHVIHASDVVRYGGRNLNPACLSPVVPMCPRDHNHCFHDVIDGIAQLPDCGAVICPLCGSHDVAQISRQCRISPGSSRMDVHAGKRQELRDRTRYHIASPGVA